MCSYLVVTDLAILHKCVFQLILFFCSLVSSTSFLCILNIVNLQMETISKMAILYCPDFLTTTILLIYHAVYFRPIWPPWVESFTLSVKYRKASVAMYIVLEEEY